jgi:pimeloyl-ACP methyl ester carboxylesterase
MKTLLKILASLVLAGLVGGGAYVGATYQSDRPVSDLKARWAPPPSQFVEVDGMQVHLRDEGPRDDPQPVVLLHGTSASLHTWQGWADALSTQHRVIRFDMPGFGLTGPNRENDYSIEMYVRFVIAMMDKLGVQQATLGGNSLGGHIAWETAVQHPDRIKALVLVDAAGYDFHPGHIPIGFTVARLPVLNKLMEITLPRGMIESSVRSVYGDPSKVTDALVDRYFELTLREGNRAALVKRFRQGLHGQDAPLIKDIRQPTLILWGGKDALIPPAWGAQFAKDIANSQLVVYPNLGHVPQEEDPAATVLAAQAFLASATPTP